MSRVLLALESLQSFSEAMANAAEAQDWEELARLGSERATLTESFPPDAAAKLPPSELDESRRILERCQQLDARTRVLVEERQKSLRVLLREPNPVT